MAGFVFRALSFFFVASGAVAEATDIDKSQGRLPESLWGSWTTTASDRNGVNSLSITLNIAPAEIEWSIACDLPDGTKDQDSVTTPARLRDGYIEVTRRAGSFHTNARACELGIMEKSLSFDLGLNGDLRLSDHTGKVRNFVRVKKSAPTSAPLDWNGAGRCTVTPAIVELRYGERALFRVSAPGMTTPTVRSEMRYVPDTSGGLRMAATTKPVTRGLDALDVIDGTARLVRSYDRVEGPFATVERKYVERYPGGVVETVELRQGKARAMCEYRVRFVPEAEEVPGSRSASAALPLR